MVSKYSHLNLEVESKGKITKKRTIVQRDEDELEKLQEKLETVQKHLIN